ncbi:multidrug and toxin extrusion protein 2-like isoform X9 [Mustela nigripes]|uniref:multidrug and toxin extrusion protein 2-like isoform X9 n=1 Tax=Mustela nigripes TaxID=77151 RepID=UPI0028165FDB|nr:multidrug and toxin extrusion protein 2-like isoform X9 [Mustela nigripes]
MQDGQQPGLGMDRVQDTAPQDRGGCCPALRRLVPIGFGAEVWTLFVLSGPLFLFQVLTFMIHVVSSVFCGHLGKLELASVTLSVAFVNVCGVSIGLGLSSACDTLMSQSFGSPNKKHVGVILQRGTLVLLLCCFPCWALFLNTQQILLLFRQDPAVSRLTQEYVLIFIPALPAFFLYVLLAKYLQNQGIVWPQVFSGIVGNCINGLANYILVSMLRLGVRGSAFASTLSFFVQTIFLFLYIVLKKLHLETWAGWSSQCLQDWGPFFSLAIPSMLMVCIEWWAYEIGSFLMGLISVLDLSGQAILYELATVVYMIPLGLSNAVCVRVGMALGAADTAQAKRSAISGMLCTVGTSLVVAVLLSLLKNKLGHIFTNDEEVMALVNKVLPVYIVFQLFEAVCASGWACWFVASWALLPLLSTPPGWTGSLQQRRSSGQRGRRWLSPAPCTGVSAVSPKPPPAASRAQRTVPGRGRSTPYTAVCTGWARELRQTHRLRTLRDVRGS